MSDEFFEPLLLSDAGEQRRIAVRDVLVGRARARRTGRRILAGAAGVALLAGGAMLAWPLLVPAPAQPQEVVRNRQQAPVIPAPTTPPETNALRITIVANEPIVERPCGAAGAAGVSVCILSDDQLLSALSTTGESFGIVRIGGRTHVVPNSPH